MREVDEINLDMYRGPCLVVTTKGYEIFYCSKRSDGSRTIYVDKKENGFQKTRMKNDNLGIFMRLAQVPMENGVFCNFTADNILVPEA